MDFNKTSVESNKDLIEINLSNEEIENNFISI